MIDKYLHLFRLPAPTFSGLQDVRKIKCTGYRASKTLEMFKVQLKMVCKGAGERELRELRHGAKGHESLQ